MLEIGQNYEFRMIEGGEEMLFWGIVEAYEHPIIKLRDHEVSATLIIGGTPQNPVRPTIVPGKVINITSPHFISAVKHTRG